MDSTNSSQISQVFLVQTAPMIRAPDVVAVSKVEAKNKTWSDTMNMHLVNCCLANKAYKKSEETFENKWKIVTASLQLQPEFKGRDLTTSNVKRKFERLKEDVEKKYAITGK